jgi:organic radical activating enzyme
MMLQLKSNLPRECSEAMAVFMEYEGVTEPKILNGYIDHQSVMELPRNPYGRGEINIDFFKEYTKYIVDGNFLILGGNDNDDESHPLSCKDDGQKESYMWMLREGDIAFKNNNYWVVMNKDRKMRISFTEEKLKPIIPELIDIKITDYCNVGCSFCYQGSTTSGVHADLNAIKAVVDMIPYSFRMEFAIGGGEPTTHPDFAKILKYIGRNHAANFTTKSTKWMEDEEKLNAVKEFVSGIAYSPDDVDDAVAYVLKHDKYVGNTIALYLHIIPEIWTMDDLELLRDTVEELNAWNCPQRNSNAAQINITMLGYKSTGRGESMNVGKMDGLIDYIKKYRKTRVGVDTKIVNDYSDELAKTNIDNRLFTTAEGEFSMYIDAVKELAYKSSYELEKPVEIVEKRYGSNKEYRSTYQLKKIFTDI